MGALIMRDLRLALRSGGSWLLGAVFFALFLSLCAVALGGDLTQMRPLAPALIWLSVLFSALLSFQDLFQQDLTDGTLEHLRLSRPGSSEIISAKAISLLLISLGPIALALPLLGLMLGLSVDLIVGTSLSLLIAAPAIAAYGVMSSALLARRSGGFLIILISAPLLVPVLIFGIAAAAAFPERGIMAFEFRALLGISLIACAVGLPAASAAISAHLE